MADGLILRIAQAGPIPLDVEIIVPRNRTLALVGPSGAGKTTVLRAIAGLHRPASGRIVIDGATWFDSEAPVDLPPHQRLAGFVLQSYGLFPHRTAAGNVREAMLDRPRADRYARADSLLARVHLDGLGDRYPAQLSGGQQQRVALARALARDPQILLLDEPFSAVDHPTRQALHRLLADIRAVSAMPIIFVSHDIQNAVRSADQLCFMRDGRSVECGQARALLDDPASALARWMSGDDAPV